MREAPADLVQSFYCGQFSIGFNSEKYGPIFVSCERDKTFPTRVLRFRRVGGKGELAAIPCPEYKCGEYVRNFLFLRDAA